MFLFLEDTGNSFKCNVCVQIASHLTLLDTLWQLVNSYFGVMKDLVIICTSNKRGWLLCWGSPD